MSYWVCTEIECFRVSANIKSPIKLQKYEMLYYKNYIKLTERFTHRRITEARSVSCSWHRPKYFDTLPYTWPSLKSRLIKRPGPGGMLACQVKSSETTANPYFPLDPPPGTWSPIFQAFLNYTRILTWITEKLHAYYQSRKPFNQNKYTHKKNKNIKRKT